MKMIMLPRARNLRVLLLLATLACGGGGRRDGPGPDPVSYPTAYILLSSPPSVAPGQSALLEAQVSRSGGGVGDIPAMPVWTVRESSSGTVTPESGGACDNIFRICARYTAPMAPGTYHVDVQERNNPAVKLAITLTVSP